MARCGTLVVAALALISLLPPPALAWYKPAAGPHHYSVGRASGLLSSFHRSPSTRRSESPALPVGTGPLRLEMRSSLRSLPPPPTQALCVKDVTPNLQSCQRQLNSPGTFQCKADVSLSLWEAECPRPEP
ncbi:neuropeptide B isoform X1 [Cricetulus griseus]|uniref:Neuropeptide B isoform X1 n=1 Tax=Cricetulus griseus TaxID=10029 RepID=A0A9J7H1Z9_CRIGR|nr:neuropeptide B isoform X1 [Cricetulus griseus]XP_035303424.1 neuropeptide B isoform X1 [Cricetulus griseus]